MFLPVAYTVEKVLFLVTFFARATEAIAHRCPFQINCEPFVVLASNVEGSAVPVSAVQLLGYGKIVLPMMAHLVLIGFVSCFRRWSDFPRILKDPTHPILYFIPLLTSSTHKPVLPRSTSTCIIHILQTKSFNLLFFILYAVLISNSCTDWLVNSICDFSGESYVLLGPQQTRGSGEFAARSRL